LAQRRELQEGFDVEPGTAFAVSTRLSQEGATSWFRPPGVGHHCEVTLLRTSWATGPPWTGHIPPEPSPRPVTFEPGAAAGVTTLADGEALLKVTLVP
jgi:hypothetical protein